MEPEPDIVASLIRSAGRRVEPPEDAYRQVLAAATGAYRAKVTRRRQRLWGLWASAAAAAVLGLAVVIQWARPTTERGELARVVRVIGSAELAQDGALADARRGPGTRLARHRRPGSHAGRWTRRAGAVRRRIAQNRVRDRGEAGCAGPTVRAAAARSTWTAAPFPACGGSRSTTPAGTARDVGTQFELQVEGTALRLRVREGLVSIDRGGQLLTGVAGEQIAIDVLGSVGRDVIAPDAEAWQWTESLAPTPDVDGRPAAELIAWVARETGRRLRYESPLVEQRARQVILHGNIRNLAPTRGPRCDARHDRPRIRAGRAYNGNPHEAVRHALNREQGRHPAGPARDDRAGRGPAWTCRSKRCSSPCGPTASSCSTAVTSSSPGCGSATRRARSNRRHCWQRCWRPTASRSSAARGTP